MKATELIKPEEMKATDLRIGNYVIEEYKNKIVQVWGIVPNHDEIWINREQGSSVISENLKYLKPIELTEELLLRAGFEKDLDFNYWEKLPIQLYRRDGIYWCDMRYDTIEIKSLHHLQNLYFAITSKELILN